MSDFASGFVTGFANTLNAGIMERQAEARKYFEKQLEIAQTTGVENRRRVKAQVKNNVSLANQLVAMGVPKDLIMTQANMNPEGLADFAANVEKLRLNSATPLTEQTFRDIYELHGSLKNSDEDFSSFFSRMYDPIEQSAKTDPEGFQQDARASIWATMFGTNLMEKSKEKLGETVVYDGLSAADLIQYGDSAQPMTDESSFATTNPEALKGLMGEETIPYNIRATIAEDVAGAFATAVTTLTQAAGEGTEDPEAMREIIKAAGEETLRRMNIDDLTPPERNAAIKAVENQMELALDQYLPAEAVGSPTEAPEGDVATPTAPDTEGAVAPPTEAVKQEAPKTIFGYTGEGKEVRFSFVKMAPDGKAVYKDELTGEEITYPLGQLLYWR